MATVDHRGEARLAFDTMQAGGIAIVPNDVGYAAMATHYDALKRIFDSKGRAPSKLNAMVGHQRLHERLHRCSPRAREIVKAITQDYDLPLGVIAPADFSDPVLARLDPRIVAASTREGTLLMMLMNAGQFHHALCELSEARRTRRWSILGQPLDAWHQICGRGYRARDPGDRGSGDRLWRPQIPALPVLVDPAPTSRRCASTARASPTMASSGS